MDTAKKSHTNGLTNCGHMPSVFGYGARKNAYCGRPRCRSGNNPAQASAKSVIASVKRFTELRHFWWKSSSTAEMNVPPCAISIHQT